jgi:hypothetical protein
VVVVAPLDVGVVRGEHAAVAIALRGDHEKRAPVEVDDLVGQRREIERGLVHPRVPVRARARERLRRAFTPHTRVELAHLRIRASGANPVQHRSAAVRLEMHGDGDRRFDRSLRDRFHRQRAVVRVGPGRAAASARVLDDAAVAVDQHRAPGLVLNQAARLRVVHHRVADRIAVQRELVMKEELHVARFGIRVADHDPADERVRVRIDGVVATQADADGVVLQDDVRDQRVAQIVERALPRRRVRLVQRAIAPDPHEELRPGMVLHPHVRKVKIGEPVLRVESDEQRAVADGKVAWHSAAQFTGSRTSSSVVGSGPITELGARWR